jgi:triacylglycerol lipase
MLDALSPQRRRFVAVVLAIAVVALGVVAVRFVLTRPAEVTPVSQDKPGPVLLVPGYGGSTAALDTMRAALQRSGLDASVVDLAGDGTGDLRVQADVLEAAAHAALDRTGATSVDVVGYSAGGVVARIWVKDGDGAGLARRVVTLGSPHHGTDLAGLAGDLAPDECPVACQQLAEDSDLLRGLNAGDETPAGPLWVSIWTQDDQTVVPPDSASLEGAVDFAVQSVCPDAMIEHGDLPRDPRVVAMTTMELRADRPTLPRASTVCGGLDDAP